MMDPKGIAITIATGMAKDHKGEEGAVDKEALEMLEEYAQGIIDGIKKEDRKQTTYALKNFIKLCQATDYEAEYPEESEEILD